jgi:hypothetical protein
VVIGEGLVCDTPEEVHQYIVSGQNEEALKAINDEKQMNACVIIEVGFYIGEQTAAVRNEQGELRITKILVVGVMTEKGFHATKPAVQYTAFLTKEEGADVSAPTFSLVTWKPEYAQNSREVQNWYKSQEMTPATRERLGVAWKSCCEHGDVVRTQFRVEYQGGAFLDNGSTSRMASGRKFPTTSFTGANTLPTSERLSSFTNRPDRSFASIRRKRASEMHAKLCDRCPYKPEDLGILHCALAQQFCCARCDPRDKIPSFPRRHQWIHKRHLRAFQQETPHDARSATKTSFTSKRAVDPTAAL